MDVYLSVFSSLNQLFPIVDAIMHYIPPPAQPAFLAPPRISVLYLMGLESLIFYIVKGKACGTLLVVMKIRDE